MFGQQGAESYKQLFYVNGGKTVITDRKTKGENKNEEAGELEEKITSLLESDQNSGAQVS